MRIAICTLPPMENKDGNLIPLKNTFAYRSSCPYNIYLLGAIIEQGGYEIDLKDWNGKSCELQEIVVDLLAYDVIMISSNSWNWHPTRSIIEQIRARTEDGIFVVGGLQASLFGRKIVEEFPVNYAVAGEAEKSVLPLLRLIEKKGGPEDVPGLIYREKGEIRTNPPAPLMTPEELSLLPVPLYRYLQDGAYNWLSIESSRGCVNRCIYCSVPYQRSWRPLAPEDFVDRIEVYIPYLEKVSMGKFLFIDDSFIIDVARSREIARLLKKRRMDIKAIWNCHILELFERDMLLDLDPYTDAILVGAESFQEETLKKIGKNFKPEDIHKGTNFAVKLGMSHKLLFSFIIGFPWQNKESIMQEIDRIYDFVSATGSCAIINWLILNPGSRMWNEFYSGRDLPMRDLGKLHEAWEREIFPLDSEEKEEINFYIRYLQNTIPGGAYRFQQHAGV